MAVMTIRDIDEAVMTGLKARAEKRGISVSALVREILAEDNEKNPDLRALVEKFKYRPTEAERKAYDKANAEFEDFIDWSL